MAGSRFISDVWEGKTLYGYASSSVEKITVKGEHGARTIYKRGETGSYRESMQLYLQLRKQGYTPQQIKTGAYHKETPSGEPLPQATMQPFVPASQPAITRGIQFQEEKPTERIQASLKEQGVSTPRQFLERSEGSAYFIGAKTRTKSTPTAYYGFTERAYETIEEGKREFKESPTFFGKVAGAGKVTGGTLGAIGGTFLEPIFYSGTKVRGVYTEEEARIKRDYPQMEEAQFQEGVLQTAVVIGLPMTTYKPTPLSAKQTIKVRVSQITGEQTRLETGYGIERSRVTVRYKVGGTGETPQEFILKGGTKGRTKPLSPTDYIRYGEFEYKITEGGSSVATGIGELGSKGKITPTGTSELGFTQTKITTGKGTDISISGIGSKSVKIAEEGALSRYRTLSGELKYDPSKPATLTPESAGLGTIQEQIKLPTPAGETTYYTFEELSLGGGKGVSQLGKGYSEFKDIEFTGPKPPFKLRTQEAGTTSGALNLKNIQDTPAALGIQDTALIQSGKTAVKSLTSTAQTSKSAAGTVRLGYAKPTTAQPSTQKPAAFTDVRTEYATTTKTATPPVPPRLYPPPPTLTATREKILGISGSGTRSKPATITRTITEPRSITTTAVITIPMVTTDTVQKTDTITKLRGASRTATTPTTFFNPPTFQTPTPKGFLFPPPPISIGGGGGKGFLRRVSLGQPRGYKPSLTAVGLKIRGTPSKIGIKTGLGIRPIKLGLPKSRKKKRKRF